MGDRPGRDHGHRGVQRHAPLSQRGLQPANLRIGGYGLQTRTIPPGENATLSFVADQAGTFEYWCNVTGHRDAGMEGTLTVEP